MKLFNLVFAALTAGSALAGTIQFSTVELWVHDSNGLVTVLDSNSPAYTSSLDADNYGSFGWAFSNVGPTPLTNVTFLAFLDADIDRDDNTFFNEYGEFIGLSLVSGAPPGAIAPSAWEIDEPGFLFGDIVTNLQAGVLDNTNAVPSSSPDDVSLALRFSIGSIDPGLAAVVRLQTSRTNIDGLQQVDPDSDKSFYLNGYATVDFASGVPEPSTCVLLFTGLTGLFLLRLRNR